MIISISILISPSFSRISPVSFWRDDYVGIHFTFPRSFRSPPRFGASSNMWYYTFRASVILGTRCAGPRMTNAETQRNHEANAMPYDSSNQEPVENTPIPATLTLPDGRVINMPAALSADQVEALAYVATLFIGPLECAALGKTLGDYLRRATLEIARQELARRESSIEPTNPTPES